MALLASSLRFYFNPGISDIRSLGYLGMFLLGLLASATIILPGISLVLVIPAGTVLNPALVGISVAAGASLGELTGYSLGLAGIEPGLLSNHGSLRKLQVAVQSHRVLWLFLLACLPGPQFDIGGFVAGATRMPLYSFLVATFLGKSVRFTLLAYLGQAAL